ncbi:hypothetical protein U4960_08900 [Altererythrobacter sp. H2]|uniref:hypothetical protein n=1 Tax=Altererythrobacter sp. H2 TaxID=3108391 RepID=UPI002B4BB995|nr:hypothetical protein [Altererythrobacter sp. H2]WRK94421.1 hypothetical protein U4960_08900 [Altererythrobacter sp. H2]
MTVNDTAAPVSGEARLKARRSAFFRYVALALLAGFVAGMMSGVAAAFVAEGILPGGLLIALWAVVILGFAWFTRDYFRRIDELDLLDNLWASTIGLYTYIVVFGSWYLFHDVGLASEPDQYAVMAATLIATTIAYLARKAGLR